MFKHLIKVLFPSDQNSKVSNYFYFEESRAQKQYSHPPSQQDTPSTSTDINAKSELAAKQHCYSSLEEKFQLEFYDYLFGESEPSRGHDELSTFISGQIDDLIQKPKCILTCLPILPLSLTKILAHLNDDDFDTDELLLLIQQEATIAAKVIELANSCYYNHSQKEITDLKSAFMLLGSNGLIEGVINGFICELTPQKHMYFRQYGNKIWQHSLTTGMIAKALTQQSLYPHEAAQAYLIGLLSNLGDMIIYQLMMEAFSYVHPDSQPNSFAFKTLMLRSSKKLTYFIAKHWHFPPSILETLAIQTKLISSSMLAKLSKRQHLACYIYEANIISALEMRYQQNKMTKEQVLQVKDLLMFSSEAKQYLEKMLNEEHSYAAVP